MRYIQLHDLVPDGIEGWSQRKLRRLVDRLGQGQAGQAMWERALVLLAHHQSEAARDLLLELEPRVPADLRQIWLLARDESQTWLGNRVIGTSEGKTTVVPPGVAVTDDLFQGRPN